MPDWWKRAENMQADTGVRTGFAEALKKRKAAGLIPVIPDIKCRSPKEGDLMRGRDPVEVAKELAEAGACALSVVTEEKEFHGSLNILREICAAVRVPVLRKDFVVSAEDLQDTKAAGASAVLLMYSCLGKERLEVLYREALGLGLEPFVETHTAEELRWAGGLGAGLTGINNRNILELERDDGDVRYAAGLLKEVPEGTVCVVESGLMNGRDVRTAVRHGADAVLVGTAILRDHRPQDMYSAMSRPCGLKICGIMDREGVDLCLRHHVDMLGFVTEYPVEVPRNLKREEADALLRYVREKMERQDPVLSGVKTCIVTGGNPDQVIRLALELRPDTVQLHGRETVEETAVIADALRREGISVIRSVPAGPEGQERIRRYLDETAVDALLLDSRDAGNAAAGGGSILDRLGSLELPEKVCAAKGKPLVFGGGVTAGNVQELLKRFRPDMIDVMTGVEDVPGKKNEGKMRALAAAMASLTL